MAFQIQIAGAEDLSRQQFVTEVVVQRSLYEHTRAQVTLRWHEHTRYDQRQTAHLGAQVLNCPIDITWKDNDLVEHLPCFHGYVEHAASRRDATSSRLLLSCVAYSKRTDLVPRFRAFQATTLLDIAQQIARSEPLIKIANASDLTRVPIVLSLQYAETDFAYLSRMLHAWSVPMAVKDQTGEVFLGARGAEPSEPFPDVGFGWTEVIFQGTLRALPQVASGGSGLPGLAQGQVGQFLSQLSRVAADYHATPESPLIGENVSKKASQTDTSGYQLVLESAVLPFSPGEVVGFEGQSHLIRQVKITGHPEQTTATQEFTLQPLTLPLPPERKAPRWPSRSVWAHVTDNEHDPLQQGRIQVEFEWEELDPQPSPERAWLHTLTPYGGGSGAGKKSGAYSGFYSLPEIGERVLVEFVGDWDSEAVVIGVIRQHSQGTAYNPRHTKRWSTPSGNEVTMTTRGGDELVRIKCKNQMILDANLGASDQHVSLQCHGREADKLDIRVGKGGTVVELYGSNDMVIHAKKHMHIEAESITMRSTGAGGVKVESQTEDISLSAQTTKVAVQGKSGVNVKALAGVVGVEGAKGVDLNAKSNSARVNGGPNVLFNVEGIKDLPALPDPAPSPPLPR